MLDGLLFTLIFISPNAGNVNHLDVFAVLLLNIYLSKATLHVSKSTETIRWSSVRLITLWIKIHLLIHGVFRTRSKSRNAGFCNECSSCWFIRIIPDNYRPFKMFWTRTLWNVWNYWQLNYCSYEMQRLKVCIESLYYSKLQIQLYTLWYYVILSLRHCVPTVKLRVKQAGSQGVGGWGCQTTKTKLSRLKP